jgi:hypothetical protein
VQGIVTLDSWIKSLSLPFDVETNLGSIGIDDSSSGVQKWPPQDDGWLLIMTCLYHHKVYRNIRAANSHIDIF